MEELIDFSNIVGFDVKPETLEGPLESGWEEIVEKFAKDIIAL